MPNRKLLLPLLIAIPAIAPAQFTDSVGFSYNNANSALIGTMIQNNIRANMMRSALMGSRVHYTAGGRRSRPMGGRPASFQPRPYPVEKWLEGWSGGDPQKRKAAYAEWVQQKAIWQNEVKARGTKPNDLAHVMATAFVLAYEAYTGNRASTTGYRHMVAEFQTGFAKDAGLRSADNVRKNEIAETAILESTDAVMRRRGGRVANDPARIEKAKEVSGRFLDRWWDEKRTGAVKLLSGKGYEAPAPVPHAPVSFANAVKLTSFHRVSPTVLPEKLEKTLPNPEHRQMAGTVTRRLLAEVRKGLEINGAGDVPVDNVGRGLTYALLMLHNVALSSPGKEVGQGVRGPSRDQVVALRKRLMVNLAANPELRQMSDREKQEMTETLYFLPAFTELLYRAGREKGNLEAQRTARNVARKSFQSFFGTTPETIDFAKL
ncbi:MAG: DUF6683 family protein [Fimbriimonas sp.]